MRLLRMSVLFVVTIGVGALAQTAGAQSSAPSAAKAAPPIKKPTALRTPWGRPDLAGTWDFRTVTSMERPAEFAGKATLTEKEAAEYARRAVEDRNADKRHDTTVRRTVNGTAETEDVALAEYAYHEANYAMFGIPSGARAVEKKGAGKSSPREDVRKEAGVR